MNCILREREQLFSSWLGHMSMALSTEVYGVFTARIRKPWETEKKESDNVYGARSVRVDVAFV